MDLTKLRPTYSQFRAETLTVEDGRARMHFAPPVAQKPPLAPPIGKGGELWQKLYNQAVASKHPQPEKCADTVLRAREKTLKIEAARHKLQVTDKVPKPAETVVAAKTGVKRARVVPVGSRCVATKMDGKQCEFKRHPDCGKFCSKHAVPSRAFTTHAWGELGLDTSLQGYAAFKKEDLIKKIGPPNNFCDEKTESDWQVKLEDGTVLSLYYSQESKKKLHIGGKDASVLPKAKKLLGVEVVSMMEVLEMVRNKNL